MPLFVVNEETCLRDGLCARQCPLGCIVPDDEGLPGPHDKKHTYCIGCGQCMAVCPADAIQLDRFEDGCTPLVDADRFDSSQVNRFLKARRSVRAFRDTPVDRQLLRELLDVTQYAPSGHNARPVRWSVAATPDKVQAVAEGVVQWMRDETEARSRLAKTLHLGGIVRAWENGRDLVCRNAPVLTLAHGPEQGVTPMEDGVIAVNYLELAAFGAGLGACWCGYVQMAANRYPALRKMMGLSEQDMVYGALMLGVPSRRIGKIPPRDRAHVDWL